jgi:hypothetical protein
MIMNKKNVLTALCVLLFVVSACENPTSGTVNTALDRNGNTGSLSITYNSQQLSEFMDKGRLRNFKIAPGKKVVLTVTGNSAGSGTTIDQNGGLFIGKDETSITLTVRAEAADGEWGTAPVKVRGWQEITQNLAVIFSDINYRGVTAAAYGTTDGSRGRWVAAGNTVVDSVLFSLAWSDDEGQTWTEVVNRDYSFGTGSAGSSAPYLLPEETVSYMIYDGPANDKKYVICTGFGNVFWSRDGKNGQKNITFSISLFTGMPISLALWAI